MGAEPFPAMLRRLRQARGWSQTRLAEALCALSGRPTVSRQEVYRWECGKRTPKYWLPFLAVVLEVPRETLECTLASSVVTVARTLAELLPPDGHAGLVGLHGQRRVGSETAEHLMARVHALRLADDVIAGKDLIGPAYRELHTAVVLCRETNHSDAVRRRLLVATGELAQIAGWIASDAGQHQRADETYMLGLSAVREAGDKVLAGQLAGSLAYQWSNTGRELEGVTLAEAAVAEAGKSAAPRARALFWDRVAWAHTKAGNQQEAMRALGEAEQMFAQHGGEAEPRWLYWVDADELKVMEARVFTELHRPLRAVPLLTETLARYDSTHSRELGLYLSWLSVAYVDANEPEHAADVAMRMLTVSADVGSDRTASRARLVLRKLNLYRHLPEVRVVMETAATLDCL